MYMVIKRLLKRKVGCEEWLGPRETGEGRISLKRRVGKENYVGKGLGQRMG